MLTITKLTNAKYLLDQVTVGVEDYYMGAGEAPGVWHGRLAAQLGEGVERMLADGRECRDVLLQLSPATRALQQAGYKLLVSGLTYCLEHPQDAVAEGYPLESVEKMFRSLGRCIGMAPSHRS